VTERTEAELREACGQTEYRELLGKALHRLVTLDGLFATDGFGAYAQAQREGCGTNASWDIFCDQCFRIDETDIIAEIEAALDAAKGDETNGARN